MKPQQGLLPGNAKCPFCGNKADGYTSTTGKEAPVTGDITVCLYCNEVGIYEVAEDKTVQVRKPTLDELKDIFSKHPDLAVQVMKVKGVTKIVMTEHQKKYN